MWDYIQSRLTDMPKIFLGVDFIQALNPLYALPIVAVILCAFLVYAFGFKSPEQPPSFDEFEVDKKSSKKRRAKENHKNKQNGKITGSAGRNAEISLLEKKKKADKAEKLTSKIGTKVVRKISASEKKKKPSVSKEPDPVVEDGNDEGWVHHISKKGRKNRKKEEHADTSVLGTQSLSHVIESSNNFTEPNTEAEPVVVKKKDSLDVCLLGEKDTERVSKKDFSLNAKLKTKSNETTDFDLSEEVDAVAPIELDNGNNVHMHNGHEGGNGVAETVKSSKEKKSTKKKKKKREATEEKEAYKHADSFVLDSPNPNCISLHSTTDVLPANDSEKKMDVQGFKMGGLNESVTGVNIEGLNVSNVADAPIEAKGSNVVFDELEGLYPESKITKKKKKVRRDH